ncbi:hypothetical protein RAJCM14343_5929 [Rhodococcus aetherivorans]|uniref:Uncharacterized protein n=1 Tax=Rhodococcus aetherivorans TaxID=191292 RepID=A0ABQ0YW11_9NOCA|nr:hypothetical protein RAJCM14343_5929 [Rhodococcus aetherivorans]
MAPSSGQWTPGREHLGATAIGPDPTFAGPACAAAPDARPTLMS